MPPTGRKRWNIHDGPQGSLRRLRNQLAEDGCAESQVVLAKQLLEEKCELEADKVSNFKQALDWLICATEQAHPEARRMLRKFWKLAPLRRPRTYVLSNFLYDYHQYVFDNVITMRCIRSGVIDEDSAAIVRAKTCLAASRQEVVARKAARDLFASLANGEQYITTAQLERRIREVCATTLRKGALHDADESPEEGEAPAQAAWAPAALREAGDTSPPPAPLANGNGTAHPALHTHDHEYPDRCPNEDIRNLTVDNLVSAAVDYCQGELPLISYELTLTDPGLKSLDHVPLFYRAFAHPIVFIQLLYLKLLYYFGSFNFRVTNLELTFGLLLYVTVSSVNLNLLLTLFTYYSSYAVMVVSTFKMLHARRRFVDFRKWSGLFLRYSDGNLQPDESENLFVRNNLLPFSCFFLALFVNLLLYPYINRWVLFSEFCVLSFFLMFLTLFHFARGSENPCPDALALLSFGINVLAKYPYEEDTVVHQGWRFLDLHISNYPSYILGNSIEFCVNSRMFFSLLIPVILFLMARRNNWQGFYSYALPHCVTLSWLQMFIMFSTGCTTYGLVRGTLALVCSFLFLPLIGLLTLTLPMFAFLQYISLSRVMYTATVVLGLCLSLGVTCLLVKSEVTKKFVTPFQLTIGLVTLLYFGNQVIINIQDDGLPSSLIELLGDEKSSIKNLLKNEFSTDYDENVYQINWEEYYTQCHSPSWSEKNMAATQTKCSVLDGASVSWEGYVKDVRITKVRNDMMSFAAWLPAFLREYFKCYYGVEYSTLCQTAERLDSVRECEYIRSVARQSGKSCHLNSYDEYVYEIKLTMETTGGLLTRHAEISVSFDHHFTNMTRLLRSDDRISFRGVLTNDPETLNIGSRHLDVRGHELNCLQCKEARGTLSSKAPSVSKFSEMWKAAIDDCALSVKTVLNFLFNPVVVFK